MNLSRLSKSARECFRQAQKIAASRGSAVVTEADFLLAVLLAKSAAGRHLLANFNIDEKVILSALPRTRPRGKKFSAHEKSARTQTIDTDLKTALIAAYKIAGRGGYPYVGTEHLVVAILGGDDSFAYRIRQAVGLKEEFLDNLLGGLGATSVGEAEGETALFEKKKTPGNLSSELSKMFEKMENPEPPSARERESALEYFCRDLTAEEDIGELIGRERELERVITILCRREKQNPLLVGDPGVGKTALVEGLARRISTGKVPAPLLEARILSVDLTALVAGTTFRGEFEARLRDLIAEAEEDGRVILFIDELHTIVGTGNVQGSLDAANILKPALARGKIKLIGATTFTEYKRHISKDAALERRFGPVQLEEPTPEEATKILLGARDRYEQFHNVYLSSDLIKKVVLASEEFIPERFLPDKAFDLLDEAASRANLRTCENDLFRKLAASRRMHRDISQAKIEALEADDYENALRMRNVENRLLHDIRITERKLSDRVRTEVSTEDLIAAASALSKLPPEKVRPRLAGIEKKSGKEILRSLERWRRRIVGQPEVVDRVSEIIRRSYGGLSRAGRPIGSFLFLGPTGTGKTFAAVTLAEELFGRKDALIRVDMSELGERHSLATLVGAPAGYVGYGEGGSLTEKIRRRPHSVVLFDEVEKAHPDTLGILLQILDEGRLTDAEGREADFSQAVIILTSNIGTKLLDDAARVGFESAERKQETDFAVVKDRVLSELRRQMKPELISRLDETLVFRPLGKRELSRIAAREIADLKKQLRKLEVKLRTGSSLPRLLAAKAGDLAEGGRGARVATEKYLRTPLADILLTDERRPLSVDATVENDEISLQVV